MESSVQAKAAKETCCECGKSVRFGSGSFVNRVVVFDDYQTKVERGCRYPEGEFVCPECDSLVSKFQAKY
jgi:hypothetical protein